MDRPSFLKRSSSSLSNLFSSDKIGSLPRLESAQPKQRVQLRSLLSHSYLHRIILWLVASLLLLYLAQRPIGTNVHKERHLARIIFEQGGDDDGADADNAYRNNAGGHIADSNNDVTRINAGDKFAFVIDPGATEDDSSFWREGMPRWLKFRQCVFPFTHPEERRVLTPVASTVSISGSRPWYPSASTGPSTRGLKGN
jgi:hypothetical protein